MNAHSSHIRASTTEPAEPVVPTETPQPDMPPPQEVPPTEPEPDEDTQTPDNPDEPESYMMPPKLRSFEDLDSDADLTRVSLQEELNKYAEAYRQEYETMSQTNPENVSEYTTDFFRKNVHSAAAQIVWLANNAESESVRASSAKYIIERATADSDAAGDPIKDLLEQLSKQPTSAPSDS